MTDYAFNLYSIILSPLLSIFILVLTLRHEKRQFGIQIKNEQKKHRETIDLMKMQHEKALSKQDEANRISCMPYFIIEKSIPAYLENNRLFFNISFTNKGNGTAIELLVKHFDHQSEIYLLPIFESNRAIYVCACPFDYEKNVVNPKENCSFLMSQIVKEDRKVIESSNLDEVTIKILYKDLLLNQYEQEFMFLFCEDLKGRIVVDRVASYTPIIIQQDI